MKMKWIGFMSSVFLLGNTILFAGDNITLSEFSISRAIPVEGEKITLGIEIKNQAEKQLDNVGVEFLVEKDKQTTNILSRELKGLVPGKAETIEAVWVPETNGLYELSVIVKSGKEMTVFTRQVPVVVKKLYFCWWGAPLETCYVNIALAGETKEGAEGWKKRGVIPCLWKGKQKVSAEDFVKYLEGGFDKIPAEGIMFDEIGWYEKTPYIENMLQGFKDFKKKHPEIPTFVYVPGSLKPELCNIAENPYRKEGAVDLLMLEAYFNYQVPEFNSYTRQAYFDQRINMARDYDVLTSSIMILGINDRPGIYTTTPEDLEDQFVYIRKHAPEMPGIGFFKSPSPVDKFADELVFKYFISPVVTSWDRDILFSNHSPKAGEEITVFANLYNIGGMDASNVKAKFSAGDPEYGGRQIGEEIHIAKLSAKSGVPPGAIKISTRWKPAKKGNQTIFLELSCDDPAVTILDGKVQRTILVR